MRCVEQHDMLIYVTLSYILSVNDALDEIMADSDDESEEQAVIDKVLDEIGIEISGKVNTFTWFSVHTGTLLKLIGIRIILTINNTIITYQLQMINAPAAHSGTIGDKSKEKSKPSDEDKEIEAMLAQLKG